MNNKSKVLFELLRNEMRVKGSPCYQNKLFKPWRQLFESNRRKGNITVKQGHATQNPGGGIEIQKNSELPLVKKVVEGSEGYNNNQTSPEQCW